VIAFDCEGCFFPNAISTWPATIRWNGVRVRLNGGAGQGVRLSPSGRVVAYVRDGEIWLRPLNVSAGRRLTNPPFNHQAYGPGDGEPAWFPNGKRLVFVRGTPDRPNGDNRTALWTVGSDGRGAKLLYAPPAKADLSDISMNVTDPDVSPDGRRIAFDDVSGHLWVTGTRGLTVWRLGPRDLNGSDPRWSPDGTRVAFLDQGQQLALLDLRTNRVRDLGFGPYGPDGYFSWSPDGRSIAVSQEFDYDCGDPTGQCTTEDLWIVDTTDGTAHRIYRTPVDGGIDGIDWR
jgi:Tol biopolymer transport system component